MPQLSALLVRKSFRACDDAERVAFFLTPARKLLLSSLVALLPYSARLLRLAALSAVRASPSLAAGLPMSTPRVCS